MKIIPIILILTFCLLSCKKEVKFLECLDNCKTFTLQGRVYNGITNVGFPYTPLKLRWEYFRGGCLYCPGDKYDIYSGKTDESGNFKFSVTLDTSRFNNYSLKLITPTKGNFYDAFVSGLNFTNLNQEPIEVVYYPTTSLTLRLFKIRTDTLRFINISHQWRQTNGIGQLILISDYSEIRPIAGGDTTIKMVTVADIPTFVTIEKRFLDNSFVDIKDSIICRSGQDNIITMYY